MSIPKWISDLAGKTPPITVKGYQVANGPAINFDDPLYAELYTKYITGQLEESDAAAIDEIEFLRGVANQATAKLISAMQNKLSADKDKKEAPAAKEAPKVEAIPEAKDIPVLEPKQDEKKEAPEKVVHKNDQLPEPGISTWQEVRYNERLDCHQAITTERKVRNFATKEQAIESLKSS